MREIVIPAKSVKRELTILSILFIVAFIANIYSIITYNTGWSELYTSLFYVITVSAVLYAFTGIIRLLVIGVIRLVRLFI